MKPLHGGETGLAARLLAHLEQDFRAPVHMVCGVREYADGAVEHVRQIREMTANCIDLVVDARDHGPNRKMSNLANMLQSARHDVLVISDSDIEVQPDYLSRVMAHLHEADVGAVSCLYHGVTSANVWSTHEALAINSHFLPNMIVAITFDLANPCCGATIAIRRSTLEAIGGFARFAAHLADDYEVGKSVRQAGLRVAIPKFTVGHRCFSDSLRSLVLKEVRAAKTVRSIDPLGHAGAFITHPFPLALAAAPAFGSNALALAACALALRVILCRAVERAFALPCQPYALLPFCEFISFFAFCASFGGPKIRWRGMEFDLTAGGKLRPIRRCKAGDLS